MINLKSHVISGIRVLQESLKLLSFCDCTKNSTNPRILQISRVLILSLSNELSHRIREFFIFFKLCLQPQRQSLYACLNDEPNEAIVVNQNYNLLIHYLDKQPTIFSDKVIVRLSSIYMKRCCLWMMLYWLLFIICLLRQTKKRDIYQTMYANEAQTNSDTEIESIALKRLKRRRFETSSTNEELMHDW